nr:MmcQ/YjbR family DNA-binding protein [Alistipes onderdonkii]
MGNDWTEDFGFAREEIFRCEETLRTIRHIRAAWGDEPEFLWERFPENAVFRRHDNAKWYAAILTVQSDKLGFPEAERMEILDIRADAETMARLLDFEHYFPGYHMNKRTWLTVRLDGSVPFGEIAPLIARSYELAGKK